MTILHKFEAHGGLLFFYFFESVQPLFKTIKYDWSLGVFIHVNLEDLIQG